MLPPACVSIPRTDVPLETIIGGQMKRRDTISPRSISEEFSSSTDLKGKEYDESSQRDKEEGCALRAFHVYDDLRLYYITDAYDSNEKELDGPFPLQNLTRKDGRTAIFLRFRSPDPESGYIKVYPGKL
ncbi:diacylglycerol kinase, partial [Trichonephila clavata]